MALTRKVLKTAGAENDVGHGLERLFVYKDIRYILVMPIYDEFHQFARTAASLL